MMKTIRKTGEGLLIELMAVEQESLINTKDASKIVPKELSDLLEQYSRVFKMPLGLPPERSKQHRIVLKEGTNPISVRPYRYPHIHKDEIEKLIADILRAGII